MTRCRSSARRFWSALAYLFKESVRLRDGFGADSNWQRSRSRFARALGYSRPRGRRAGRRPRPTTSLDAGRDDGAQPLKPSSQLVSAICTTLSARRGCTRLRLVRPPPARCARSPGRGGCARSRGPLAVALSRLAAPGPAHPRAPGSRRRARRRLVASARGARARQARARSRLRTRRGGGGARTTRLPSRPPGRRAFRSRLAAARRNRRLADPARRARQSSRDCASSPGHTFCVDVVAGKWVNESDVRSKPRLKVHTPSSGTL